MEAEECCKEATIHVPPEDSPTPLCIHAALNIFCGYSVLKEKERAHEVRSRSYSRGALRRNAGWGK